jgi:hypothetical protein
VVDPAAFAAIHRFYSPSSAAGVVRKVLSFDPTDASSSSVRCVQPISSIGPGMRAISEYRQTAGTYITAKSTIAGGNNAHIVRLHAHPPSWWRDTESWLFFNQSSCVFYFAAPAGKRRAWMSSCFMPARRWMTWGGHISTEAFMNASRRTAPMRRGIFCAAMSFPRRMWTRCEPRSRCIPDRAFRSTCTPWWRR